MTFDHLRTPTVGRRAARRAEQRRRRRRRSQIVGAALGVLVLLGGLIVLIGGGDDKPKTSVPTRTQKTLLLQVKGPTGTAVASALLAHDPPSSEGSVVLVPPQVIATVPGAGSQPFGNALRTSSAKGSRNALADLMGITVDGSWVLDVATFARLVDQVGGIQATVDVPVLAGRVVVLAAGAQRLDGAKAYAFATYLAPGEEEQTRLTRLQAVVQGILSSLPDTTETLVKSLGPGSESSLPSSQLTSVLRGLKADDSADQLQYRSLPVIKVDAGTVETRFRIDAPATTSLVDELLAQSVPPGARTEGNRVLVLNAVGTPGLGEKVREKLVPAGFVYVGSRNAPTFGQAKTQVLVKDTTTKGTELGARVARALGVPVSSVQASDQIGTIADVVVVVGRDFKAN